MLKYQKSAEEYSQRQFVPLFFVGDIVNISMILDFCIACPENCIEVPWFYLQVAGIHFGVPGA